ncbi:hypothetical protein IWQ57_005305, partial [Coemansia nantahalensis]
DVALSSHGSPGTGTGCVLARIVQFECRKGELITCRPIERLFKRCPGLPSVELVQEDGVFVDVRAHSSAPGNRGGYASPDRSEQKH